MTEHRFPSLAVHMLCLLLVLPAAGSVEAQTIDAYFSPAGGLQTADLRTEAAAPLTIDQAFFRWLDRIPPGGEVKVAIYSFSSADLLEAILAAARRGVTVKLLMDGADSWKSEQIETIAARCAEELRNRPEADLHLMVISKDAMHANNRFLLIPNEDGGKRITGSMHQKFGVAAAAGTRPETAFFGSANFTGSSNDSYYENRIFLRGEPAAASRFEAEFARLWNRYGTPRVGTCPPEKPVSVLPPDDDDPRIVFNPRRTHGNRPDEFAPESAFLCPTERVLLEHINRASRTGGTVDAALFSFTRKSLADALLQCAAAHPTARVRVLLDQHQAGLRGGEEDWRYLMGPYLEREIKRRRMDNIAVRYVWRSNAFSLREGKESVALDYRRFPKMHHKFAVVNQRFLLTGSYNWTESAAFRNLENIVIFDSQKDAHRHVVRGFTGQFEAMWQTAGIKTITGDTARALSRIIKTVLLDAGCRVMRLKVENRPDGYPLTGASARPPAEPEIESLVSLIMADLVKLEAKPEGLSARLRD